MFDTRPYRRSMKAYQARHGLGPEPGFDVRRRGPLGPPGRRLARRVSTHMSVFVRNGKRVYPDVRPVSVLTKEFREALIPAKDPQQVAGETAARLALAEQGVHEVPWGSNDGPRVNTYQHSTGAYRAAWCASFFWWCWRQAGWKSSVSANAWASATRPGCRIVKLYDALPGDGVTFNIGEGHIGIYLSHTETMVKTVDGNTSDQVAVRERPVSEIRAVFRPML